MTLSSPLPRTGVHRAHPDRADIGGGPAGRAAPAPAEGLQSVLPRAARGLTAAVCCDYCSCPLRHTRAAEERRESRHCVKPWDTPQEARIEPKGQQKSLVDRILEVAPLAQRDARGDRDAGREAAVGAGAGGGEEESDVDPASQLARAAGCAAWPVQSCPLGKRAQRLSSRLERAGRSHSVARPARTAQFCRGRPEGEADADACRLRTGTRFIPARSTG